LALLSYHALNAKIKLILDINLAIEYSTSQGHTAASERKKKLVNRKLVQKLQ
jgi:hypothetical protein